MKILIVTTQLPYPLIDGSKKGIYYPIKYLAERGNEIHLACLSERNDEEAINEMKKYCTLDIVTHSKKPTFKNALASLFDTTPYYLSRYHNKALLDSIIARLGKTSFDVIEVEGIHSAFYGLSIKKVKNIPVVMRLHNVESVNLERFMSEQKNPFLKAYIYLETKKLQRYEARESGKFDKVLMVSRDDQDVILSKNPAVKCVVVPAGVDTSLFSPRVVQEEENSVLWLGALHWLPNQDSFWWFFKNIVPVIVEKMPGVTIYVIGSNPPEDIQSAKHPNVKVLGFVEDVRQYIEKVQVCVVPLRIGSGIRLKLLEMFAMKKAVVSTTIGCEGLNVTKGDQLLIEDDAKGFADAVVKLLSDYSLRRNLGDRALSHVRKEFEWAHIAMQYEAAYRSAISSCNSKEK